jgi:hypothetical protein
MKNIVDRLLACANDPMWANHAEVSKELCASAAEEIESLRELLCIVRAERDELAAKHYASMAEIAGLLAWVEEAVNYVGCETWSPSLKAEGEALLREDAA